MIRISHAVSYIVDLTAIRLAFLMGYDRDGKNLNLEVWSTPPVILKFGIFESNLEVKCEVWILCAPLLLGLKHDKYLGFCKGLKDIKILTFGCLKRLQFPVTLRT